MTIEVDKIACDNVEVAIYASAFTAKLHYNGPLDSPTEAAAGDFYASAVSKARFAKEFAENAVRWHRSVAS